MKRVIRSLLVAIALLIATALSALAGGWAVITLDDLPKQIVAGQAFAIGFTVRQHGRTLRDDLAPLVRFDRSDAQDSRVATAKRAGDNGHYVAEITLPSSGQWNWKVDIEQFGMVTQDMPALTVADATPVTAPSAVAPAPSMNSATMPVVAATAPAVAIVVGLLGAIGATVLYVRTRRRFALALMAVAVLIGALGFVSANTSVAQPVESQPAISNKAATPLDQAALGRDLFLAKGCVMCHAHPAVTTKSGPFWIGAEPPKLDGGKYSAEYLRVWLKDPAALKPQTVMPKLGLSDIEIEALIAFLQAK